MAYDFEILLDFLSSIAAIAILAWSYGAIRRRFAGAMFAPILLGLMFGLVAVLQMHAPLSPMEGLIVDMRAVPVALAGAFLGRRGLAACLVVAMAGRYDIGGVGMLSGLVGLCLSGAAGLVWDRLTRHVPQRGFRHMLGLILATSCGLFAGLMLPPAIALWFYTVAVPPLLALYLVAIPAVGTLLERERIALRHERKMQAGAQIDSRSGLMTRSAFVREIANRTAAETGDPPVTAVLQLRIRHQSWLSAHWGASIMGHILGGLRHRLSQLVHYGDLLGVTPNGDILIALTEAEAAQKADLTNQIRRAVSDRAIALPQGDSARVAVENRMILLCDAASADAILVDLARHPDTKTTPRPVPPRQDPAIHGGQETNATAAHPALFAKAEQMLSQRNTRRA